MQLAVGWEERFDVCDEVLMRLMGEDRVAPELRFSWRTLLTSVGRISVGELAAVTGYSRQHLGRLFRDEFGLAPSWPPASFASRGPEGCSSRCRHSSP